MKNKNILNKNNINISNSNFINSNHYNNNIYNNNSNCNENQSNLQSKQNSSSKEKLPNPGPRKTEQRKPNNNTANQPLKNSLDITNNNMTNLNPN